MLTAGRAGLGRSKAGQAGRLLPFPPLLPFLRLFRCDHEVAAPVLLPAGFVLLGAERRLLALADDRHAVVGTPRLTR